VEHRRDIADALEPVAPIWENADGLMVLLLRLFVMETDLDVWTGHSLANDIERYVIGNPDDLGRTRVLQTRRCVNPNAQHQRALVEATTPALSRAGMNVIESGSTGGYPDFSIVRSGKLYGQRNEPLALLPELRRV